MAQGNDGFRWRQVAWGTVLVCDPLLMVAPHVFTTRTLDLGDRADRDAYAAVAHDLGVPPRSVRGARQVHGTAAVLVDATTSQDAEGDILLTSDVQCAVSVRVADCVPILIGDNATSAVAAVHAGWRGTLAGAASAAVAALTQHFGSSPADLVAAIGPSIGPCCYEVGGEVRDAFAASGDRVATDVDSLFRAEGDRWRLDLWTANRDQLVAAGVPATSVHLSRECTACNTDRYFSFRAEKTNGRQLAAIRPQNR
jgi:YfiH family protein